MINTNPESFLTQPPLVISATAFAAFKRCRKQYELSYVRNLDVVSSKAAQEGSSVHEYLQKAAQCVIDGKPPEITGDKDDPMYHVAAAYLQYTNGSFPQHILLAEEPVYTLVLEEERQVCARLNCTLPKEDLAESNGAHFHTFPAVFIRTTFDLVYADDGGKTIVGRDYKTFEKYPTLNLDLDFQGRIYTACLMKRYETPDVRFEWEYIRRTPPRAYDIASKWTSTDCYLTVPLYVAPHEIAELWRETRDVARDLVRNLYIDQRWYRVDLKGHSPFTCGSCFQKDLCAAEVAHGELDDQTISILSTPRNEADRVSLTAMLADPRVIYWATRLAIENPTRIDPAEPLRRVYGEDGVKMLHGTGA